MEVKIKNTLLDTAIEMFYTMELKGKKSRHRTKFVQMLGNHYDEVVEQEKELLKENCYLDEDGNPKMSEDGKSFEVKDMKNLQNEIQLLQSEELVIASPENRTLLLTIREILDECEEEYSNEKATVYAHLCDIFKVDEDLGIEE